MLGGICGYGCANEDIRKDTKFFAWLVIKQRTQDPDVLDMERNIKIKLDKEI